MATLSPLVDLIPLISSAILVVWAALAVNLARLEYDRQRRRT